MKKTVALILCLCLCVTVCFVCVACSVKDGPPTKIRNTDDFIKGMDMSSVISLEQSGVTFKNADGHVTDVFKILANYGVTTIRVRVWVDPYNADGNGYGGGNCDVDKAVEIGKRATRYGMDLLVDFHYSDFWADPAKYSAPKAWVQYTVEQKETAIYNYTVDSLTRLKSAGIAVGLVQVGNETTTGLCGETDWQNVAKLMNAGSKAVREIYPTALVATHFTNPEKANLLETCAGYLNTYKVDYDVFGTSYYPCWHGTLGNLKSVLAGIASTYGKKVMVMETQYPYTSADTDGFANTLSKRTSANELYDYSVEGQYNMVKDVFDTIAEIDGGLGVCYWEGAWITVSSANSAANAPIWEKYGSGWATSYSGEYDPDDAGKWYGGSAVDNQAFFDKNGKPLASLKVFLNNY